MMKSIGVAAAFVVSSPLTLPAAAQSAPPRAYEGLHAIEIPYANVEGQTVTAETARTFGVDLAHALRTYLEQ